MNVSAKIMDINYQLNSSRQKIVIYFCLFIFFCTSWAPLQPMNLLGTDFMRSAFNYLMCALAGVVLLLGGIKHVSNFELGAMLSVIVYRMYTIFYSYVDFTGLGFSTILFCIVFCLQPDDVRSKVFIWFKNIVIVTTVIGIICYISYIVGLGVPYLIADRGYGVYYISYKLFYLMSQYDIVIRFNDFFEEPGYYGTFAAFFLCADKLNFRSKNNIILFIGGLLSLSLGFIIILIIYYILVNISQYKKWIGLVLVALALMMLQDMQTGNPYIDAVVSRMNITDEGLAGDNRYGQSFERVWDETLKNDMYYTGYGAGYAEYFGTSETEGLGSIKSYIVNFGIIGTLIMFGPIFILGVKQAINTENKNMLLYILINYISLYQRPCLFVPAYFIIFICGISYVSFTRKDNVIKNE